MIKNDPVPEDKVWDKMKECKTHCNDYNALFDNRQVYCDQPGPTEGCKGHNYTYFQDENTWKHMRSMNEEWEGNHTEAKLFDKDSIENERKLMHDVDLAHNKSVNADPNEKPVWFPED